VLDNPGERKKLLPRRAVRKFNDTTRCGELGNCLSSATKTAGESGKRKIKAEGSLEFGRPEGVSTL